MFGSRVVRESAAPLILSMLLRKRRIPSTGDEVLVSSTQPHAIARVLEKTHRRSTATRAAPPAAPLPPTHRCAGLLSDLPGFAPAAPCVAAPRVVALSCGATEAHAPGGAALRVLPLTLSDVAAQYRAQHRERFPSATGPGSVSPALALLPGTSAKSTERDLVELHCGPGSKDLAVIEAPSWAAGDGAVWEALLVAECVLKEHGSLLLVSPDVFSHRLRRFLQWRFHSAHCAAVAGGAGHYALCTSLATDFGATSVCRDDFPGFAPPTQKRPRKWNPYRREQARKFVVSMRPGFTDAPHTKDALLRSVARDKLRDDQLRDADDAFFSVAHSMVEKGTHYSQPSD